MLPYETCWVCGGGGKRAAPPDIGPGPIHCNYCHGVGEKHPDEWYAQLPLRTMQRFVKFLTACGGFRFLRHWEDRNNKEIMKRRVRRGTRLRRRRKREALKAAAEAAKEKTGKDDDKNVPNT